MNSHFLFFGSGGNSFKVSLHQKCGKLFSINFCKKCKEICKSTIGNKNFFAIENVMFSIFGKCCTRTMGKRIRTSTRFSQCIGAKPLSCCEFCQIFLFLRIGAKCAKREHCNTGMAHESDSKGTLMC